MKKNSLSLVFMLVIATLLISACGAIAAVNPGTTVNSVKPAPTHVLSTPVPLPTGPAADLLSAYQGTLEQIYAAVSPSVVNIRVVEQVAAAGPGITNIPGFPFFNAPQGGQPQPQFQAALGSGFVWDQQGHIVTNNHVVAGADKIEVTFSDGTIVPAKLVGADPDSDLAVIQVDVPAEQLHPVQLGDSSLIKVGQLAIAIGNPFGLEGSMTTGIISAVGRTLPAGEGTAQSYSIPDIIQTDAPINPGNSGGVLIDVNGQVLGVTAAIESPVRASAGVGFAIPSAIVNNVVPTLISAGKVVHPWLGISGTDLVPDLSKPMGIDPAQRGALVMEVMPGSPAEKAGLQPSTKQITIDGQNAVVGGDVITAIDGQPVLQMNDIIAYLARSTQVGQKVTLTILRDGKEQSLDLTLAARPTAEERASSATTNQAGLRLGIAGVMIDENIAKAMDLPSGTQGVLIEQVEPGSLADKAGLTGGDKQIILNGQTLLLGGDIITALEGKPIANIEDLKAILAQLPAGHQLTITILRDGKEQQITIKPGQ